MTRNSLRGLIDSLVASIECEAQQIQHLAQQRGAAGGGAPQAAGQVSGLATPGFRQHQHQHQADDERRGAIDEPVGKSAAAVR